MTDGTQTLTSEVVVKGAAEGARSMDRVGEATKGFVKEVATGVDTFSEASARLERLAGTSGRFTEKMQRFRETVRWQADEAVRDIESAQRLGGVIRNVTWALVKLQMAVVTVKVALGALRKAGLIGSFVRSTMAIVYALKNEISERRRLIQVMRLQGQVQDELVNKQLSQKAMLEQISGTRRGGGFATAGVARRAQAGAVRAKEQFTQLPEEDINLAFGMYGDVEGLSQRDVTDLAILAHGRKLGADPRRSAAQRRVHAERVLRRYRASGDIERFARRETVQGEGMGRAEYFTGQPTERAARAYTEMRTRDGGDATLRARLAELLPPEYAARPKGEEGKFEDSVVDKVVELIKTHGTTAEIEKNRIRWSTPARGGTALVNEWDEQALEIGMPDQPGFWSQGWEAAGVTTKFMKMRIDEYEEAMRALQQVEKEGLSGRGRRSEQAARAVTIVNNNYQNAKIMGPDARSQAVRRRNGEGLVRSRER